VSARGRQFPHVPFEARTTSFCSEMQCVRGAPSTVSKKKTILPPARRAHGRIFSANCADPADQFNRKKLCLTRALSASWRPNLLSAGEGHRCH